MKTYTITLSASEGIFLYKDELNDSWVLVREQRSTFDVLTSRTIVLSYFQARKIAEIILKEKS